MTTLTAQTHAPLTTPTAAPRFDLYGPIHKALRSFMGETLLRVGRIDMNDEHERGAVLAQLDALLDTCLEHIRRENEFVHTAIDARRPGGAARTVGDHVEHLDSIAALRAESAALLRAAPQVQAALAFRLYHHLALFVAENLQHMHIEETANNAALWAAYTDAELIEIHERLLANIAPQEFLRVMRWMVPALNPTERAIVVGGIKAHAPPEALLGVLAVVRPHLDLGSWTRLARAVGVAPGSLP